MKTSSIRLLTAVAAASMICGCNDQTEYEMGTYGYDLNYLAGKGIDTIELKSGDGQSKVMLSAGLQGRVMTSTTSGNEGQSYGWINYRFLDAGEVSKQFNPIGGEERFWIGPEGGPNSWYFKKDQEQIYENWIVPAGIDTERYEVIEQTDTRAVFTHRMELDNASDYHFIIDVNRTVEMVEADELAEVLGTSLPTDVKTLAYKTINTLTNGGENAWNRETGMPSVWLLGSFNPTPTTTVFIPYDKNFDGKIINDEYFGKVPADRLVLEDGMAYFKIDGEYRSKIGLPCGSAKDICGSYDSEKKVLNILKYTVPAGKQDYVNGQWGPQEDPFCGDVINSYNDGITDTGTIMGPFYEIETSSPGAALAPGESLTHTQYTIHIEGSEETLAAIVKKVFGADLSIIAGKFQK